MAYSQAWNETTPVGSITLASDIDLVFRNLKRDLRERHSEWAVDFTVDPILPKAVPVFIDNSANSTGTAGSEQTLQQYSVPANRIGAEGIVRINVIYRILDNGGTKRFRIKLGGTDFYDFTYGAGQAQDGVLELFIANTASASSQVAGGFYTANGGAMTVISRATGAVDTTAAQNIDFTGQVTVNGDAVQTESILISIIRLA